MFEIIKKAWNQAIKESQEDLNMDLAEAKHISGADDLIVSLSAWMLLIVGILSAFMADGLLILSLSWIMVAVGGYILLHISEIDKNFEKFFKY
jgi:hypothetical protein